jgi:hypothetical protein
MVDNNGNDQISLKELIEKGKVWFQYLLCQWKIVVLAGVIGAGLGLAYSFTRKPVYYASLSFALEDEKSGGLGSAIGLASSLGMGIDGSSSSIFTGSNLAELLKSRTMVEQTLMTSVRTNGKVVSLAEMYIQIEGWREKWKDEPKLNDILFVPNMKRKYFSRVHDSILGALYQNLSMTGLTVGQKDKKNGIITIDVNSSNELFSKSFTEALLKVVSDFYISNKSKKARLNMDILQRQTDSIRGELNGAITGVAVANDNTFMLNPALNVRRTPSARRQVDVQENTAILTELVKQAEIAKVALRKETPLVQVIDRPILPLKMEKFGKAKGIVMGASLVVFLTVLILVLRKVLRGLSAKII